MTTTRQISDNLVSARMTMALDLQSDNNENSQSVPVSRCRQLPVTHDALACEGTNKASGSTWHSRCACMNDANLLYRVILHGRVTL